MMRQLKIDPEFEKVIPPLTNDEYQQLRENIVQKDIISIGKYAKKLPYGYSNEEPEHKYQTIIVLQELIDKIEVFPIEGTGKKISSVPNISYEHSICTDI